MRALVTGGGGFLGGAIARMLLERGDQVVVLGRNAYPHMEAVGATCVQCDLANPSQDLAALLADVDVVFHVAALAGMWGPYARYHGVNVTGTENLLAAAKQAGVPRFVYTSSPSVTFHGTDEEGVTEAQASYPETFLFHYPHTKALAEQAVLAANSPELATCALRPHLIYGPGDPHLLPRLLDRQRAGRLRVIGDGTNKVALTYIDNAAVAHVQAADALGPDSANAGKAYFITDADEVPVWEWLGQVFEGVGAGPIRGQVSASTAFKLGGLFEWIWRTFGIDRDPPITRFTVAQISTSHWYDLSAAYNDFGYRQLVGPQDALDRTIASLRAD